MDEAVDGLFAVPTPEPVAVVEPEQAGEKRVEVLADANPQVMIGFRKPAISHPDDAVFDVIDMILADGRTSRLYRKLVMEQQLATDIGVFGAPEVAGVLDGRTRGDSQRDGHFVGDDHGEGGLAESRGPGQ